MLNISGKFKKKLFKDV